MKRHLLAFVLLLCLAIAMAAGCGRDESPTEGGKSKPLPAVQVQPARLEAVSRILPLTGEVVAPATVTIRPTVEGPILFCPWREGDRVTAGQRLVEITRLLYQQEVRDAEASLDVARAKLADLEAGARPEEIAQAREAVTRLEECTKFTKSDLEAVQKLVEDGSLPGQDLDRARVAYVKCQSDLDAARQHLAMLRAGPTQTEVAVQESAVDKAAARLDQVRAKLAECIIKAPFTGVIAKVFVSSGDIVRPGVPLLELFDPSSLVVRFAVPEADMSSIHKGTAISVMLDAYPGRTFSGSISRVYPQLDPDTRTRTVEAELVQGPPDLAPGVFARISLPVATAENAVVVADAAVITTPAGDTVVYVVENGKASLRKVSIGIESEHRVQIVSGVQPGENVVVSGNEKLKDGAAVKVMGAEENAPSRSAAEAGGREQ